MQKVLTLVVEIQNRLWLLLRPLLCVLFPVLLLFCECDLALPFRQCVLHAYALQPRLLQLPFFFLLLAASAAAILLRSSASRSASLSDGRPSLSATSVAATVPPAVPVVEISRSLAAASAASSAFLLSSASSSA